jgi:hypothetical protein
MVEPGLPIHEQRMLDRREAAETTVHRGVRAGRGGARRTGRRHRRRGLPALCPAAHQRCAATLGRRTIARLLGFPHRLSPTAPPGLGSGSTRPGSRRGHGGGRAVDGQLPGDRRVLLGRPGQRRVPRRSPSGSTWSSSPASNVSHPVAVRARVGRFRQHRAGPAGRSARATIGAATLLGDRAGQHVQEAARTSTAGRSAGSCGLPSGPAAVRSAATRSRPRPPRPRPG